MKKPRTYRPRRDFGQLSAWAGGGTAIATAETIENNSSAEEILRRFGPDPYPTTDEYANSFWSDACAQVLEYEAKWKQQHQIYAWIDKRPDWTSFIDWEIKEILGRPDKPCVRTFRLELLGGGQIKVSEDFRLVTYKDMDPWVSCAGRQTLRVQAETTEGLRTASALLDGIFSEMQANAAVFYGQVQQAVADRVAATLRLIDSCDDFMALLLPSDRCGCCGRPLKDEVSRLLNIGPNCAELMRLPHDIATANRVLARRRELLGEEP